MVTANIRRPALAFPPPAIGRNSIAGGAAVNLSETLYLLLSNKTNHCESIGLPPNTPFGQARAMERQSTHAFHRLIHSTGFVLQGFGF
jgi:hypothetical protein